MFICFVFFPPVIFHVQRCEENEQPRGVRTVVQQTQLLRRNRNLYGKLNLNWSSVEANAGTNCSCDTAINKMKRVLEGIGSCITVDANIFVCFVAFKEEEPGAHDRVLCRRC